MLSLAKDRQRDEVYCGKGEDVAYVGSSADKIDYVDDSCEEKDRTILRLYPKTAKLSNTWAHAN
jgi:hypothetical protein